MRRILGSVSDLRPNLKSFVPDSGFRLANTQGLKLWLKANDLSTLTITSSPKVDAWLDKSPSALSFVQSTASLKPESGNTINGKNVVYPDGVDDVLQYLGTPFTGTKGYFAAVVRIPTSVPASNGNLLAFGNAGISTSYFAPIRYDFQAGQTWFGFVTNTGGTLRNCYASTTPIAANTTYLVEAESDDSTLTMRINNLAQTLTYYAGTNVGTWAGDIASLSNVTVGDLNISIGAANGRAYLAEIVGLDGVNPSNAWKSALRRYLANEWAITLA